MTPISFSLHDRTVLVTGAASGIGRAVAVGVAAAGAAVGCLDLTRDAVAETIETITDQHVSHGRSFSRHTTEPLWR